MHKLLFKIVKSTYKINKKGTIYLNFILILSSILESASIAMVFPILALIVDNNKENFFYQLNIFNFENPNVIFYSLIFFLFFFIIKSLLLIYFSWWKSGFIFSLINIFSKKIFENYLYQNIEFHFKNRPSFLLKNSYDDVRKFATSIDLFFCVLCEVFIFLLISIGLFIYQPFISLIVFFFFSFISLIYIIFIKNYQKIWSKKKFFLAGNVVQILQQSFESIKYIKISNTEHIQLKKHELENDSLNKYSRYSSFFSDIPKNLLETFGIIILITIISIIHNSSSNTLNNLIPIIGLFVASSFRILPGLNRIISTVQNIYSISASIETVYRDLELVRNKNLIQSNSNIPFKKFILFKNVSYRYPDSERPVFSNLNINIKKNDFICIKGASGIGKTTLIDLICGIIKPSKGEIKIDGKKINQDDEIRGWQKCIGYIPQSPLLYNASLIENITYFQEKSKIDFKKINEVIIFAELSEFVNQHKEGLNYRINERGNNLSGGQIQRIAIARSLYFNPDILICDEFTSSLDKKVEEKILKSLEKLIGKITLIIVSHNPKLVNAANKIITFFQTNDQETKIYVN